MDVYDEIKHERLQQDRQWGGPVHDDKTHDSLDWLELIRDRVTIGGDPRTYRKRMVQVAALAVAALESLDRIHNWSTSAGVSTVLKDETVRLNKLIDRAGRFSAATGKSTTAHVDEMCALIHRSRDARFSFQFNAAAQCAAALQEYIEPDEIQAWCLKADSAKAEKAFIELQTLLK